MKKLINILKSFLIGTVAVLAITVTFSPEYFLKASKEYTQHSKQYSLIIKARNNAEANLVSSLESKVINSQNYITKYKANKLYYSNKLKEYTRIKKQLKLDQSYLGYSSYRNFLLGISKPIFSLVICMFLLFLIIKHIQDKHKKNFYLIISCAFILCSGYWVSWSFLSFTIDPKRGVDFPRWTYDLAIYVLPFIVFLAAYFLFKALQNKDYLKKLVIRLFDFLILEVPKNHISKPNQEAYNKDVDNLINETA